MLLHLFFPLWIIISKRNSFVFLVLNSVFLIGGMVINGVITWKHDLRVGIFTFEDYYLYSYLFNKPYTKLVAMSLGMFMGKFYFRLLAYKSSNSTEKRQHFALLHFFYNSKV
jgi:hypothetical protein